MLTQYIRNKLYYGIRFEECPVSLETLSETQDKYFMTTNQNRTFVFLSESLLNAMGIGHHVVAYEHIDAGVMVKNRK